MKVSNIFPQSGHTDWIQGVEANLLRQRRLGNAGGISLMITGAAIQLAVFLFEGVTIREMAVSVQNFGKYLIGLLPGAESPVSYAPVYEIVGLIVLLAGIGFLFISRHTRFLMKETAEPFRYTFWIDEFKSAGGDSSQEKKPGYVDERNSDQGGKMQGYTFDSHSALLRHDLMERLNQRIGRFSLLDLPEEIPGHDAEKTLSAHIHINGYYTIRENKTGEWVIQLMPRIRIGPKGNSSKLSFPVRFALEPGDKELPPERYNQLVERVYSSVATEIYKQIELDVKKKMDMFPTKYLRAVALSNEARDYMRSNTVDAYDHAIKLYREALEYFQVADSNWKKYLLIPFLWRFRVKFLHARAAVEIGYAECLIYRRQVSALTGRYHNPLFEIPANLSDIFSHLERLHHLMIPGGKPPFFYRQNKYSVNQIKQNRLKSLFAYFEYPADTRLRRFLLRPSKALFLKHSRIRFEACLVISLAYYYLRAFRSAKDYLLNAKSIHPERSENDALYLLTAANIEPRPDDRLILLRKVTEIAPDFEIALFMLAQTAEMGFRREDEIEPERAQRIIKKYEDVLKINPGNIASLSSLGYVLWLVGLHDDAARYLLEGCETKATVRQTFTGHLNYGLARIYAEQGKFQECYDYYKNAISADPGVGVYNSTPLDGFSFSAPGDSGNMPGAPTGSPIITPYYDFMGVGMFNRYKQYLRTIEQKVSAERKLVKAKDEKSKKKAAVRKKTADVVYSYVLNDYANACINYYLIDTAGNSKELDEAISAYIKAVEADPKNKTALFNLQQAYNLRGKEGDPDKGMECLQKAERMGATWLPVLISSIESGFRQKINLRNEKIRRRDEILKELKSGKPDRIIPAGNHGNTDTESQTDYTTQPIEHSSQFYPQGKNGKWDRPGRKLIDDLARDIKELDIQISENKMEFKRILERTKLSFLRFNESGIRIEDLPDPAAARKILNEIDLNALIIWLEFSLIEEDFISRETSETLCKYLQHFYPEQFNCSYLLGTIYYNKGDYPASAELFSKACKEENDENDSHCNMLGNAYFGMQQYINAILNYKKAFKQNEKNPIYYCNCGQAYGQLGEWKMMLKYCRKAVDLRRKVPRDFYSLDYYYELLAEAIFRSEGWDPELHDFINDEELKTEAKARLNNRIGNLFFEVNDYLNAIPYYKKAISYEPKIPIYHCNLGRAYGNLIVSDYKKMLRYCKKAVTLRNSYSDGDLGLDYYYEYLAEAHFMAGKLEEFLQIFETDAVLKKHERASVYNRIGRLYQSENKVAESIGYFEKAVYFDPHNPVYLSNTGLAYSSLEKWPEAEEAIKKAIQSDPENALYLNDLGNIYYRDNRFAEAADCYKKVIALKPDIAVYHSNLGLACTNLGLYTEAEDAILNAIKLDPVNSLYQNDLGNIYYRNNDFEKAIQCYSLAITFDPANDIYKSNLELARGQMPGTLEGV